MSHFEDDFSIASFFFFGVACLDRNPPPPSLLLLLQQVQHQQHHSFPLIIASANVTVAGLPGSPKMHSSKVSILKGTWLGPYWGSRPPPHWNSRTSPADVRPWKWPHFVLFSFKLRLTARQRSAERRSSGKGINRGVSVVRRGTFASQRLLPGHFKTLCGPSAAALSASAATVDQGEWMTASATR